MRLVLHPKVYSDIDEIMRYYERVAAPGLADEFYTELRYGWIKQPISSALFRSWCWSYVEGQHPDLPIIALTNH